MPAIAANEVVTLAGEVLLERKSPRSIKREATLGERFNLRVSDQPEVPHTQDEKDEM